MADEKLIVVYNLHTRFGGEYTTGFCCIYKSKEALMKGEPNIRLVKLKYKPEAKKQSRKAIKIAKNKKKKVFGTHPRKSATKKK